MVKSWNGRRKGEELVDNMPGKAGNKRRRSSPMEEEEEVVVKRESTGPTISPEAQKESIAVEEQSYPRWSVKEDASHSGEDLEQKRPSSRVPYQSNTSKKRRVVENQVYGFENGLTAGSRSGVDSFAGSDTLPVKRSTHKRFGSEELWTPNDEAYDAAKYDDLVVGDKNEVDQAEAGSDSEDDVPEIVTASVGLSQARNTAAEEAKAMELQSRAKKEKRRKRDAQLKEQATGAKKQRRSHVHSVLDLNADKLGFNDDPAVNTENSKPEAYSNTKTSFRWGEPLPRYLPEELLAKEPPVRFPTPPPVVVPLKPTKKRFVDADPKPLKDITRGTVTIRVLEDKKSILPPRASKASKSLKESWLAGHRGRNTVALQRKKMGGDFLRS